MIHIPISILPHGEGLPLPFHATPGSAGLDLYSAQEEDLSLKPMNRVLIPCGFSMALPMGYEAQIRPRSGFALKEGITVLNAPGTIDQDYRGEIQVLLINLGLGPVILSRGMRIAQMVISPYTSCTMVNQKEGVLGTSTSRGDKGFGSTGMMTQEEV